MHKAISQLFFGVVLLAGSGCATNWIQVPLSMQQQVDVELPAESAPEPKPMFEYRSDSQNPLPQNSDNQGQAQAYWRAPGHQFQPVYTHKALANYAEQLTMSLIGSVKDARMFGTVGVSSFVYFDDTLQQTDLLGNHLAEALITEIQQFGLAVIDFKVTDNIAVNASGDYVFSRQAASLASELAIDYVLAGTLQKTAKGVTVNARLVHSADKYVIATAKVQIPHFVILHLSPDYLAVAD